MSYLLTFLIALAVAAMATPLSMKLGWRWGAVAKPGGRHVHKMPIPRLGGIAIYCAFWIAILLTQEWDSKILGLFLGSTIIMVVGVWDDITEIRPVVKLGCQIAAATLLLFFGFSMEKMTLPFLGELNFAKLGLAWVGMVMAVFWIVGLVNTVNISDGLDGLAAGICVEAALLLFWSANRIDQVPEAHLNIALAGAALGFLFLNFHPARVFMGDSGSMFLGYIIGAVSIMGLLKTATILGLVFPLLVLGMPLTDMTFAIIRRKLKGRSISTADRGHLHHRLLDAGFSQRKAVLLLYFMSGCFGISAVLGALGQWIGAVSLLVVDFALLVTILMRRANLFLLIRRRQGEIPDKVIKSDMIE